MSDTCTVVVCDHEYGYCPLPVCPLPNTPSSGKIASTRPLALLCSFAYTQDAKDRLLLQGFPPFSPVNVAVPSDLSNIINEHSWYTLNIFLNGLRRSSKDILQNIILYVGIAIE